MKSPVKYIAYLLIINIIAAFTGYLLIENGVLAVAFGDLVILSLTFSLITGISMAIFIRGQSRDPASQTLYTFISIGVKFLLELVLILIWFIILKKKSFPYLLLFFVLYLALTLFSVFNVLRMLKNRVL